MKKKILEYNVVFEREKDGGFSVWVPDLPGCTSQGENLEEAIENIKASIQLYLEDADMETKSQGTTHKDQFVIPVQVITS